MRKGLALAALVGAAALALAAGAAAQSGRRRRDVRSVFFANWDRYARNYFVNQIPADKINQIDYAFAFSDGDGLCAERCVVGLPGADVERGQQRRRRRRRSVEPGPAPVRQLQPAAEAEGRAPEPAHRDLDRRLDGLDVFSDAAATPRRGGRSCSRASTCSSGATCRTTGDVWPAQAGGAGADAGPVRRDQHRLGVPGNRPRQRGASLAGRRPQRDAAPAGVPPPARRVRRVDGQALPADVDIPGGNMNSTGSWELHAGREDRRLDRPDERSTSTAAGTRSPPSTRRSRSIRRSRLSAAARSSGRGTRRDRSAYFLQNGVPADKLVVGIPFYGKEYTGVGADAPRALSAARRRTGERLADLPRPRRHRARRREPDADRADGRDRERRRRQRLHRATSTCSRERRGSTTRRLNGGTFISYVDPHVRRRARRARQALGLRGAWAWEISNDDNANDLVNALTVTSRRSGRAVHGAARPRAVGSGRGHAGRAGRVRADPRPAPAAATTSATCAPTSCSRCRRAPTSGCTATSCSSRPCTSRPSSG